MRAFLVPLLLLTGCDTTTTARRKLPRTPVMDQAQYAQILSRLEEAGYVVERLVRTQQPIAGATSLSR